MAIELVPSTVGAGVWLVRVDANDLHCGHKPLPYPTCIGTISQTGKINVWSPAAYKPRGYRAAAKALLEEIRDWGLRDGEFQPSKRVFRA